MKLKYFKDTDTLYIDLSEKTSTESLEVTEGIVIDFDKDNKIVGIEIEQAKKILDFNNFNIDIPFNEILKKQKIEKMT
ncbi:MAG: DUF2283 domain-containing protein [Bacteroidales bacterium]|nr:DUF2283 domain-containing protein [Bacteroidales bacterium]